MKPNVLIFSGYGLNCEEETKYAFDISGANADIVHINDLIDGYKNLDDYQILAFPGGFSYGDDTGSGNAYGQKIKNHLWEKIMKFTSQDKLVIGICNGFQILVNLGLLQGSLQRNTSARYTVRWVDLRVENKTPWLNGIKNISLPIAHGEGRFYAPEKILNKLKKQKQIALKYIKGEICEYQNLETNPNGALENIAGITDETGKILGLMPHPERAIFFTQLPHWTYLKEKYLREKIKLPKDGTGIKIFLNAISYFK